jgi:hypothetical protein
MWAVMMQQYIGALQHDMVPAHHKTIAAACWQQQEQVSGLRNC